ncbi:MAG: hypothetical protein AB1813_10205 [Verrucomicrobiota bacterium]
MEIPAGPLAYRSRFEPVPLTEAEEAALTFAACGITGYALADLAFERGQGGNIMAGLIGRTMASGDGIQTVSLVVTNDTGTWLIKRPHDFSSENISTLIELGRRGALSEVYRRSRVQIKEGRAAPPSEPLFNLDVNRWSAQAPGTTYFLPVNELTWMYINGLLEIFSETTGAFIVDERCHYRPAGLARFARSRGGHLEDDPHRGRVATVRLVEQLVTEFVTVEQGMMLQNLGLAAQALGLGGFPNFANHEFGWCHALGFRMHQMPVSRYLGVGPLVRLGMKLMNRDPLVPYPIGLEVNGEVLLKPFCPPYYPSMREAVLAVVDRKFGAQGVFRQSDSNSAWQNAKSIGERIPGISEQAIDATIAYGEYLWNRYGRFPVYLPPFRTVLGFQACHLDVEFYEKFYRAEAVEESQRQDFAKVPKSPRSSAMR